MPEFLIERRVALDHEVGANLLSLLAYSDQDGLRERAFHSLCATFLRGEFETSPHPATLTPLRRDHAFRDVKVVGQDLRALLVKLRDRLVAAHMAIGLLQEIAPKPSKDAQPREHLSLNKLSELVASDLGYSCGANVETRIWRPSIPVIHLGVAIAVLINEVERVSNSTLSVGDFLAYPEWAEQAILEAGAVAEAITRLPRVRIDSDRLVRVRMVAA